MRCYLSPSGKHFPQSVKNLQDICDFKAFLNWKVVEGEFGCGVVWQKVWHSVANQLSLCTQRKHIANPNLFQIIYTEKYNNSDMDLKYKQILTLGQYTYEWTSLAVLFFFFQLKSNT